MKSFPSPRTLNSIFQKAYHRQYVRLQSTYEIKDGRVPYEGHSTSSQQRPKATLLSRIPTSHLVRSLVLGQIFTTPLLFKPGLAVMRFISESNSSFLNADKNPLLNAVFKPLIYKQFCAGSKRSEIQRTINEIKKMGFQGVILGCGKEVLIGDSGFSAPVLKTEGGQQDKHIEAWLAFTLETLSMVGKGDYVGIKYTGAGPNVCQALVEGRDPPPLYSEALDMVFKKAKDDGIRIWIDAEQQAIQHVVDRWTIDLMRRHNRNGQALISNTIQAYLKSSRDNILEHLRLAQEEGWTLGIKLVRGAYIGSEQRSLIHDTKPQTDDNYNGIARDLLCKTFPGFEGKVFPKVDLFLAGHNIESIRKASAIMQELAMEGKLDNPPSFGQLQGMADEVSCELLRQGDEARAALSGSPETNEMLSKAIPKVYKCLMWGTVHDSMQFLVRRAIENQGAAERMKESIPEIKRELWRRMWSSSKTV